MVMRILIVLICLVAIGVFSVGYYLAPDALRSCNAPQDSGDCQKADAIVAVSGGNTSVRADEAIRLYKAGWSDYLIFSGAAKDQTGPSNAAVMKRQALEAGVPAEAIIVEEAARTTHENAKQTQSIVNEYDIHRMIVVTSPYHQRRAGLEFGILAGNSVTILNHPAANDPDWPWYWWITPWGWWLAGGEMVKIAATYAGESA